MNESTAERLVPEQAAELARVLDLQSRWENMRVDGGDSIVHLQALQRAFEAYRLRKAEYTTRYRNEQTPDLSPSGPNRFGAWCRALRAVFRRATEGIECPVQVIAMACRQADRIAERVKAEPVGRESPPTDMAGAIRQLDALIAWSDRLDGPRLRRLIKDGEPSGVGDHSPIAGVPCTRGQGQTGVE